MSTRLQVVMGDTELEELRAVARRRGTTVSAVVRQALRDVTARAPAGDPARKLAAVQATVRHSFPGGEVAQMLHDIDRGRGSV